MRVVFLGDSVTAGYGLRGPRSCESYPKLLQDEVTFRQLPWELIPSALDGIDTRYALRRFARLVTAHQPDVVVILLGLNDARPAGRRESVPATAYEQNLLAIVDRVRGIGAEAMIVTPNPRFDLNSPVTARPQTHEASGGNSASDVAPGEGPELMCPYAEAAQRVARRQGLPLVDLYRVFAETGCLAELVPDGIHPGPSGHRLIAATLTEQLLPLLAQMRHRTDASQCADTHSADARSAASHCAADLLPSGEPAIGTPSGSGRPATE